MPVLVWKVIAPFRGAAAWVLALTLADALLSGLGIGLVLPLFQMLLAPEALPESIARFFPELGRLGMHERMIWLGGVTLAVFFAKAAVALGRTYYARTFTQTLWANWVDLIGRRYVLGRYRMLQQQKQGVLLNNWFNETMVAARFFTSYISYISSLVLMVALVAIGFVAHWLAMSVFLALGAITVLGLRRVTFGTTSRLGTRKLELNQAMNAAMAENLMQVRELKLLNAEAVRLSTINDLAGRLKRNFVQLAVITELPRLVGELAVVLLLIGFLIVAVTIFGMQPAQFVPLLMFFLAVFYRLVMSAGEALSLRMKASSDVHSMRLIHSLSSDLQDLDPSEGGLPVPQDLSDIEFSHVSFAYDPAHAVLDDASFVLQKGKLTYLLGGSGAGKTTLLDLLLRLQQPSSGCILAAGRDVGEYNLAQWRRCFGYVSQDAALFNGTLRMNLQLADHGASEAAMIEACRLAGIHDFIASLPHGYDTPIGDRGQTLSGGQRKRIAIARALIHRPQVLILDEATTSFEEALEAAIVRGVMKSMPQLTVVMITHRLQAVQDADPVVLMHRGKVIDSGLWATVRARSSTASLAGEPSAPLPL